MHRINENIYLGDVTGASNKFMLKRNNITHILTVAQGIYPKFRGQFNYKLINILDSPSANLKKFWPECISFIKQAIQSGGNILVHCFAGVSRSASTVIAYLMQEEGLTYQQAFKHCKACRPFINPNPGFKRQLITFSKELGVRVGIQSKNQASQSRKEEGVFTRVEDPKLSPIQNATPNVTSLPSSAYVTSKRPQLPNASELVPTRVHGIQGHSQNQCTSLPPFPGMRSNQPTNTFQKASPYVSKQPPQIASMYGGKTSIKQQQVQAQLKTPEIRSRKFFAQGTQVKGSYVGSNMVKYGKP